MAYTYREAIKTAYKYLNINEDEVTVIDGTNGRGILYCFDGIETVIFIYPISCKQNNRQNFFDTRDSGAKERAVAWSYAKEHNYRYFCFGFNEEQDRYKNYILSLESDENSISNISFRKSEASESTGTQVNIPADFIPSKPFERIKTPKGFFISAVKTEKINEYIAFFDNRPYMITVEAEEEDPEEKNKRLFKYWMGIQIKPEGDSDAGQPYSVDSINSYVSNIATTPWSKDEAKSLFYTTVIGDVQETIEILELSEKKNNTQRSAVKKYLEYLVEMEDNQKMYEEIMKHNLWGIHIKKYNDALSEINPHVCIGWSGMGDLTGLDTTEDIKTVYKQEYPNSNNRAMGQDVGMIRRFVKELQIGDYIIFAESAEFHIGRIESDYYYDDTEYPEQNPDYVNTRKVKWLKTHISRKDISSAMHKSLATAMSIFGINDYRAAVVDLLRGTYKKDDDTIDDLIESVELKFTTDVSIPYDLNRIVFGAPGTGKSFELKQDSENVVEKYDGTFERVTFHPEYSYSQFVGTYKPIMDDDGVTIKYQYVPGPFMRVLANALKSALSDSPKPCILIIEEINRAKVAAVFGEVFQLLDRDEEGKSEYEIHASEDIRKHLADVIEGKPSDFEKLRIPNNMFIWATMNSADQGVFPMDTAFKRRWSFEYLGINEGEDKIKNVAKLMLPGTDEAIEWNRLRKAINDKMASGYNVNEDKLMGPFFIAQSVLESDENGMLIYPDIFTKVFKNKVIMYLYEDAVKQNKKKFFDGCEDNSRYSSVCEAFNHIGIGIFGKNFKEDFYDKVKE